MADVKISALPALSSAALTDLFAVVQGGVTYKGTLTQLVAAIPDATGSTRGILSAADWTTFNSKQSALTFSTGLTNAAGTVTSNLSTGVAGGQSVIGGTAASNSLTLSSTSNATKGKILFGTSAYDESQDRLGIGTVTPQGIVDITTQTNDPTIFVSVFQDSANASGGLAVSRARGTISAPTAILNGDRLLSILARGYRTSGGNAYNGYTAAIIIGAGENYTSTANASYISFETTSTTNLIRTERLRIFPSGNVAIGTTTDAGFRLDVNGTARVQGDLTISTKNIITDTTTGTKIGTATGQKLGFWNATPIAQPTTAVTAATLVGGGGTNLTDTDTFDGYTLQQVVKAIRNAGLLA